MNSPEPLPSTSVAIPQPIASPALPFEPRQQPAPVEDDGESGIMLKRSIAALLRYKWLIVAIVLVSGTTAFLIRKRFSAVYEAEGKVWISEEGQARSGPVRAAALLPSNSWGDLLMSYAVLGKTVRDLHLYVLPTDPHDERLFASADVSERVKPGTYVLRIDSAGQQFTLSVVKERTEAIVEKGAVGDSIGQGIGLLWAPSGRQLSAGRSIAFTLITPRAAALDLRGRMHTILPRDGNLMHIYVSSEDGWHAAREVNSVARHLVATADEFKRRNLTENSVALDSQLTYTGKALQEADSALERFRMQTITLPSEAGTPINGGIAVTRNPVITNYFNLKLTRETVARERGALEQTLADIQAGKLDVSALWQVLPTEAGTQEITALLQDYTQQTSRLRTDLLAFTDDYQGVKDARAALAQLRDHAIPTVVNTLIEQLKRREADLSRQIGEESSSLQAIPSRTIEEVRLTRNVEARTQLYSNLRNRFEEARLTELSIEPDLSVLDSATTPEAPISNRGRQVLLIAVFGSFAGAAVLAILLDQLDKRIRYTQQITKGLGLHILGAVPHAAHHRKPDPANVSQLVESFRSLRLNVTYAAAPTRPLTLTVTSAGAGEGKSFVTANLALAFAGGGYRTLLIDGDLRRGGLHTTFATDRRPGLTELLRGAVGLNEVLRPTSHPRLALLPSGARFKTAPELLTSESFGQLMAALRTAYDVILIDSPPLAAGMDPHALCVTTGNVLFVVRLAHTDGEFARQKLEVLQRFPLQVIGTVANDMRLSGSEKAEYSYLPEYAIHEEDEEFAGTAIQTIR